MRHALRRFLTLSREEQWLLVHASLLLTVIFLAHGRMRFTTLRRLVVRPLRRGDTPVKRDPRLADRVVWAVTAASQRAPGWATCLTQALAVQALLARRGYASSLHIGVMHGDQRELKAHAWVEDEGRILIGGPPSQVEQFSRLTVFDIEAANESAADALRSVP